MGLRPTKVHEGALSAVGQTMFLCGLSPMLRCWQTTRSDGLPHSVERVIRRAVPGFGLSRVLISALALLVNTAAFAGAPATVPVYFEDSHAGSFYWMIQNLALDRDYQLVLVDAHSDASQILESDVVRQRIMEAAGVDQLDLLARRWRSSGTIQAFNWIEPLMPHPLSKVWWIPAESLSAAEIAEKQREVRRQINAHQAVAGRREGDFGNSYEVADLRHFRRSRIGQPVVVSIDLDYFAPRQDAAPEAAGEIRSRLGRILDHVLQLPNLQAINFAISRPYLVSEAQAHLLLYEALRSIAHVVNANIYFEPFADTGEDRSERAKEFYRQRMQPPRYAVENAPPVLRTLLLQNASRIAVSEQNGRWQALLEKWRREEATPRVRLWVGNHPPQDGTEFTVAAGDRFRLRIENGQSSPDLQVRWKILSTAHAMYNLTDEDQGFANGAPKYLVDRDGPIDAADDLSELDDRTLLPFFDRKTGLGTLRVYCEIHRGGEVYLSSLIRLSRYQGEGYIGKLTEIFNLPYVYGSALLKAGGRTSADAAQGADCSHFIIYGKRRQGANVPYVNPQGLLPYLDLIDEFQGFQNGVACGLHGPIVVTPELLKRGLLLHFGKHVAAVYGNRGPSTLLTRETQVVHQLEGPPEITTFGTMAAKYRQIRVMTFR
jgi:hypothetical protein